MLFNNFTKIAEIYRNHSDRKSLVPKNITHNHENYLFIELPNFARKHSLIESYGDNSRTARKWKKSTNNRNIFYLKNYYLIHTIFHKHTHTHTQKNILDLYTLPKTIGIPSFHPIKNKLDSKYVRRYNQNGFNSKFDVVVTHHFFKHQHRKYTDMSMYI